MKRRRPDISRRRFLQGTAAGVAAVTIVPRHVLGGADQRPPSETFGGALIGCGGRGGGTFDGLGPRRAQARPVRREVPRQGRQQDDLHRLPPRAGAQGHRRRGHRHAAALARPDLHRRHGGRQGRALRKAHDALHRRGPGGGRGRETLRPHLPDRHLRPLRRQQRKQHPDPQDHGQRPAEELQGRAHPAAAASRSRSGAAWSTPSRSRCPRTSTGTCTAARRRCGRITRTASAARTAATGTTRAAAWPTWASTTSTASSGPTARTTPAPSRSRPTPRRPTRKRVGMWGWVELKYADGLTLVLDSGEWGKPLRPQEGPRRQPRATSSEEDQKKLKAMPDPEPLVELPRGRQDPQAGRRPRRGRPPHAPRCCTWPTSPSASGARSATTRSRKQIIGDEEANRLVNQPMRAPWHLWIVWQSCQLSAEASLS